MNTEAMTYDFTYLNTWTTEQLKQRLGAILPTVDILMSMHNAKDKVIKMELACVDAKSTILKEHILYFGTLSTSPMGYPQELESFIHNLCTFLCAEKNAIKDLLAQ